MLEAHLVAALISSPSDLGCSDGDKCGDGGKTTSCIGVGITQGKSFFLL